MTLLLKILNLVRQLVAWFFQGYFFLVLHRILTLLLPNRVFGAKKAVLYQLDTTQHPKRRDPRGIECFRGNEESVQKIIRELYGDNPGTLAFYEDFYRQGIEPWAAQQNGKIVGVFWLYTGRYLLPWEGYDAWLLDIEIEPAAKFFANEFVHPEARRQGISTILAEHCFDAYPGSAFYTCIDEVNFPSKKMHTKLGFRPCGTVYFMRLSKTTRCLFVPKTGKRRRFKLMKGVPAEVSLRDGVDEVQQ